MIKNVEGKALDKSQDPPTNLSRQAYDYLLQGIINLKIPPGDIIVESAIAEDLGTSRAPVREALKKLTTQGFLRVLPRTGYMVVPVTAEDLFEILQMRVLLEGEAAFMTASRISEPNVQEIMDQLESRQKEIHQLLLNEEHSLMQLYDENTEFHVGIARAAGNRRLASAVGRILDEDRRVLLSIQRRTRNLVDGLTMVDDHLDLLTVIRKGNPDKARTAMQQHVEKGRIRLDNV